MKENKPVVLDNCEFEYRVILILKQLFDFLKHLGCHEKYKIQLGRISYKNQKFSVETLMGEIKAVVSEKNDFGWREESVLIAVLGRFRLSKLQRTEKTDKVPTD